jgi:hypothetical protein
VPATVRGLAVGAEGGRIHALADAPTPREAGVDPLRSACGPSGPAVAARPPGAASRTDAPLEARARCADQGGVPVGGGGGAPDSGGAGKERRAMIVVGGGGAPGRDGTSAAATLRPWPHHRPGTGP